MAERNDFRDHQSEDIVRRENSQLVQDIIRSCRRSDYKKNNVLLVGQSGSGKSSVVNTIRKALIGQYVHVAEAGAGEVPSNTLQLNWYPNCGASEDDFRETMWHEDSFGPILRKLPDIFDVAGMADSCSDDTKEILRLLLGGCIPPSTDIGELVEVQLKIGTGYLTKKYNKPKDEHKISVLLFVCDCGSPIPYNLIKCVREVLGEPNQRTLCKKHDIDVYLLLTKYDEVTMEYCPSPQQETRSKFEIFEKEVTDAFVISGTEDQTRLRWTSYNNSVGFDNPYIDNKSLQLLKHITTPKRFRRNVVPEHNLLHEWKVYALFQMEKLAKYSFKQLKQLIQYLAFELQQYLLHNYQIMSQGGVFYESYEGSPAWFQKETEESMFPPSAENASLFNLDRCIRVLPHDNDTAAGFYAVIRKLGPLPSEKANEEKMEEEVKEESTEEEKKENGEAKGGEGDKKEEDKEESNKPPYTRPLRCDVSVSVMEIEWDTEITDNKLQTTVEKDFSTFKQPSMRISKTSIPMWYQKKMHAKWSHYEDVEPNCPAWVNLQKMYDLKKLDPSQYLLKFVEETKGTSFFFLTPALKNVVKCNPEVATNSKGQCAGLMIMKVDDCDQGDMSVFGHLPLLQFMGKRVINIPSSDLVTILSDRALSIKTLSDKIQRELNALGEKGPVYFVYEPKTKTAEPKCPIVLRRDKYKSILKDNSTRKGDNNHLLRLCGIDPTKEDDEDDEPMDMD